MSTLRRLSGKELIQCRKYFWGQDKDNDGQLSWEEFSNMCHTIGLRLNETQMNKAFTKADCKNSGNITFSEFCQTFFVNEDCLNIYDAIERVSAISKERLSAIHNFFYDKTQHHYGKIPQLTFIRMTKTYGIDMNNQELNKAFQLADDDKDGLISYQEFIKHIVKNPIKTSDNITALEMTTLQKSFAAVDDGDGKLSRKEFQAICKMIGMELDLQELNNVYQRSTKDENGLVRFDEFCEMYLESRVGKAKTTGNGTISLASIPPAKLAHIRKHFSACDIDRNGRLDLAEFQQIVVDLKLPQRAMTEALKNVVLKRKNSVSFAEFMQLYSKVDEATESAVETKEITNYCKYFWLSDKDDDGRLSFSEFSNMLTILGMKLKKPGLEKAFMMANLNDDGYISFKEFVMTYLNKNQSVLTMNKVKEIFHNVDKNRTGTLSSEEFLTALEYLGNTTDKKRSKRLLRRVDLNGNGRVTLHEYCTFLDFIE